MPFKSEPKKMGNVSGQVLPISMGFFHVWFQFYLGKFQKFHYNATKNMELYGSEDAPEYDLSRITAKIHILYGTYDRIATIEVSFLLLFYTWSITVEFSPGVWYRPFHFHHNFISEHSIIDGEIGLKRGGYQ